MKMKKTVRSDKRPPASAVLGLVVFLSVLGSGVYVIFFYLR